MAQSPFGSFAAPAPINPLVGVNPLQELLAGFTAGNNLAQLPQKQEQDALNQQLALAISQAKLAQLQQPEIFNVGGSLVVRDPTAPNGIRPVFTATGSVTPESQQFVGVDANGKPVVFGPKTGSFRVADLPPEMTGNLLPRTQPQETQTFVGFNNGAPVQFGNRGSGITTAPVEGGVDLKGPIQPKTQTPMRKGVLLTDDKGNVKYDVLSEGESVPEGSKIFTTPTASNESGLRQEFLKNQVVKDFTNIAPQYQRVQSALEEAKTSKNFTAVDQTLINTFNKILDPSSVVRESEYARTGSDQSVLDYLKGKFDPNTGSLILGGADLSPETRDAMARMAKRFFDASQQNYTQTAAFYSNVAKNRGFDPSLIIPPIGGFQFTPGSSVPQTSIPTTSGATTTSLPKIIKITPRAK